MTFQWPHLLWLLLVPVALLAWDLTRRRRAANALVHPKILRAEAGTRQLTLVTGERQPTAARARPWLTLGLAFAIIAVARPQWGRIEEPVFDQSREILLAVDLSRSMLAPDVKPSRLDRAKLLIQSLLEKLQGERIGLVVFSGTAFLQSPLSADYEILREFLPALGPDFLPEGGTNYRALLDTSLQAFGGGSGTADRFLIILSDGEATDDNWQSRLDELKAKGVRVIGLGVGTAAGAMIPDGTGAFVKDERGAVVLSKLESGTLQQLAQATGGVYRDASTWIDLPGLIEQTVEAGRKGSFVEKNTVRLVERFQWPLALALWCFLVSFYYEFPVRPRPRAVTLRTPGDKSPPPSNTGDSAGAAQPPVLEKKAAGASATAALLMFGLFAATLALPFPARAAVKIAPPPTAPANTPAPATSPGSPATEPPPLARIVGRLSNVATRTARDWAEFARETVSWGSRLQSSQQPVPAGPVNDALQAVDLGAKLDASTADWPKLREELEALLRKPEPPPQQQPQQNQQQQNKDQQQQEQKQSQQDQQKSGQPPPQNEQKSPDQQKESQPSSSPQNPKPENEKQKSPESAFGEMNKPDEPPPSETGTQKVGGAPDKKEQPKEAADPALAQPLEKLDQLRNQDSPAQLFQLMEGDRKPSQKPAKDW